MLVKGAPSWHRSYHDLPHTIFCSLGYFLCSIWLLFTFCIWYLCIWYISSFHLQELNNFRGMLGTLFKYDWISVPLVYTQVMCHWGLVLQDLVCCVVLCCVVCGVCVCVVCVCVLVQILHSALSPFDLKIACLCQSNEIDNKHLHVYVLRIWYTLATKRF